MPNGGSDCCGTCWFNARNKGEAGYGHVDDPEPNFCTIRGLAIEDPFYTYCGNHPHRRPQRDPIPLGPVFVGGGEDGRDIWQSSPDTPEIRLHLLELVAAIQENPASEYPLGMYTDELVVWQLGEFRETRATAELNRILGFSPGTGEEKFGRSRASLVAEAEWALAKINADVMEAAMARVIPKLQPQLILLYRDTTLSPAVLAKYQVGAVFRERTYCDATDLFGGLVAPHRFLIFASNVMCIDETGEGDSPKWRLFVGPPDRLFQVINVHHQEGKSQITLWEIPEEAGKPVRVGFSSEQLAEIIRLASLRFTEALKREPLTLHANERWLDRLALPLGIDDEGEFFETWPPPSEAHP